MLIRLPAVTTVKSGRKSGMFSKERSTWTKISGTPYPWDKPVSKISSNWTELILFKQKSKHMEPLELMLISMLLIIRTELLILENLISIQAAKRPHLTIRKSQYPRRLHCHLQKLSLTNWIPDSGTPVIKPNLSTYQFGNFSSATLKWHTSLHYTHPLRHTHTSMVTPTHLYGDTHTSMVTHTYTPSRWHTPRWWHAHTHLYGDTYTFLVTHSHTHLYGDTHTFMVTHTFYTIFNARTSTCPNKLGIQILKLNSCK